MVCKIFFSNLGSDINANLYGKKNFKQSLTEYKGHTFICFEYHYFQTVIYVVYLYCKYYLLKPCELLFR